MVCRNHDEPGRERHASWTAAQQIHADLILSVDRLLAQRGLKKLKERGIHAASRSTFMEM